MSVYTSAEEFLELGLTPLSTSTVQNADRSDQAEYPICSEEYIVPVTTSRGRVVGTTVQDEPVVLPCSCTFGRDCITAWVQSSTLIPGQGTTCPTCRTQLWGPEDAETDEEMNEEYDEEMEDDEMEGTRVPRGRVYEEFVDISPVIHVTPEMIQEKLESIREIQAACWREENGE